MATRQNRQKETEQKQENVQMNVEDVNVDELAEEVLDRLEEEEKPRNINAKVEGEDVDVDDDEKRPGRPIDLKSKRQHDMLVKAIKREMGVLRKGRPVDPSSARQQRLEELEEKRAKGILKPGRPAYTPEERERAEKEKERRRKEMDDKIKAEAHRILVERGIIEE